MNTTNTLPSGFMDLGGYVQMEAQNANLLAPLERTLLASLAHEVLRSVRDGHPRTEDQLLDVAAESVRRTLQGIPSRFGYSRGGHHIAVWFQPHTTDSGECPRVLLITPGVQFR